MNAKASYRKYKRRMSDEIKGIPFIPLERQTNGYSCGSTCMKMACKLLQFHPFLSTDMISEMAGTNPFTGTTEREMAQGLDALGLTWERPKASSTDDLRNEIDDGNLIFLRTMLPGGMKHWVLVNGYQGDDFLVTCPSLGRLKWKDDFVYKIWSARDFDHFIISTYRNDHKMALKWEKDERLANWKPVYEMTLREYTGNWPVFPDEKLSKYHQEAIIDAAREIRLMGEYINIRGGEEGKIPYEEPKGFSYWEIDNGRCVSNMVVLDDSTGEVAGGIFDGLRWVAEEYRGRGLGAEIALAAYSQKGKAFLFPNSYSQSGYASRVASYHLAIKRAIEQGLIEKAPEDTQKPLRLEDLTGQMSFDFSLGNTPKVHDVIKHDVMNVDDEEIDFDDEEDLDNPSWRTTL